MARNRRVLLDFFAVQPPPPPLSNTPAGIQLATTVNCLQAALNYNCQSNERSNRLPKYVYIFQVYAS